MRALLAGAEIVAVNAPLRSNVQFERADLIVRSADRLLRVRNYDGLDIVGVELTDDDLDALVETDHAFKVHPHPVEFSLVAWISRSDATTLVTLENEAMRCGAAPVQPEVASGTRVYVVRETSTIGARESAAETALREAEALTRRRADARSVAALAFALAMVRGPEVYGVLAAAHTIAGDSARADALLNAAPSAIGTAAQRVRLRLLEPTTPREAMKKYLTGGLDLLAHRAA